MAAAAKKPSYKRRQKESGKEEERREPKYGAYDKRLSPLSGDNEEEGWSNGTRFPVRIHAWYTITTKWLHCLVAHFET